MKQIVFDTVIDGKPYKFVIYEEMFNSDSMSWSATSRLSVRETAHAFSLKSEEDAILKLVKLLENDK